MRKIICRPSAAISQTRLPQFLAILQQFRPSECCRCSLCVVWIRWVRAAHNCLVLEIRSLAAERARRSVLKSGYPMYEPLVSGGIVRRLWIGESELYRQHLLRLDAESRRNRFGGAVSDELI